METQRTCDFLAQILNGKGKFDNEICTVTIPRNNIHATIGNKPFHSIEHIINFEAPDESGNSLITGELVLLESEVPNMVSALSNAGIIVSAVNNHWIVDNPKLMYINFISASNRVDFANKLARILKIITG